MTKTYTEVLEAIQKANEDLLKLEFGCKVILYGRSEPVTIVDNIGSSRFLLSDGTSHYGDLYNVDNYNKILGKEPQLQDVCNAIEESNFKLRDQFKLEGFEEYKDTTIGDLVLILYNFHLPFSQQDESLYTFLHKILCSSS